MPSTWIHVFSPLSLCLFLSLQNSTLTIEEFHSKLQEATNFPLRPFVIPFLKVDIQIYNYNTRFCLPPSLLLLPSLAACLPAWSSKSGNHLASPDPDAYLFSWYLSLFFSLCLLFESLSLSLVSIPNLVCLCLSLWFSTVSQATVVFFLSVTSPPFFFPLFSLPPPS